jgi:hypothetical protein
MLQRMGINIKSQISTIQVRNIAAVFVTATLPPFSRPGVKIDVNISSIGDAKSLVGGTLLLTPLAASDGQVYAVAQGPLVIGGYSVGPAANSKVVNHPTAGRIPLGALVERDTSLNLSQIGSLSLLLRDPDFDAARELAAVVNRELGGNLARVIDSRRVEITDVKSAAGDIPVLMARISDLSIPTKPARQSRCERTHLHHRDGWKRYHQFLFHPPWRSLDPGHHRVSGVPTAAFSKQVRPSWCAANDYAGSGIPRSGRSIEGRRHGRRTHPWLANYRCHRPRYRAEAMRVEGHTDNQPIHNEHYQSNWELSTSRASDLIKVLIVKYGFDPDRLSAAGYAEFHPVALNDTPEGRARNRRVDIVILSPTPQDVIPPKPTVVPVPAHPTPQSRRR